MEYHLLAFTSNNKKEYEVIDKFESLDKAEKKMNKLVEKQGKSPIQVKTKNTKNKVKALNKEYKIIPIPSIKTGLKIFRSGIYYRTITDETKSLWWLNNIENPMYYDDCIMKDRIYKLFYEGIYDTDKEVYDKDYINNSYDPSTDINISSNYNNNENNNVENESEEN